MRSTFFSCFSFCMGGKLPEGRPLLENTLPQVFTGNGCIVRVSMGYDTKVFLCFPPPPAESAQLILMSKKWGKSRRGVAPSYIESGDHLPPSAFFYRASPLSTHGICSVWRGGGGERRRAPALTVGEKGGAGVEDGGQESISGWRRTRQRLGSVRRSGARPIN